MSLDSKSTTKVFPGFDRMFWLSDPMSPRAFRGDLDMESDDIGLTRGENHPAHPLRVNWAMGSARPGEVIWTTLAIPIIVADSVVQLLRSHGFTGWSLYDVAVHDKQGQLIPGYSGLAITGRCGPIDWAQSIEVPRIRPAGIFPAWIGLFFDPASWDGSDLFMTENSGHVLVVEEVKKALERAKVRNVHFTRLDQYETSGKIG